MCLNMHTWVYVQVLLRKQLRCLHEKEVTFPVERWEKKQVTKTTRDQEGKQKETKHDVLVLIRYTIGDFEIEQTKGKNTMNTVNTTFDLSKGFNASIKYSDGEGETDEYDGATFSNGKVVIGHPEMGITEGFSRHTLGYDTEKTSQGKRLDFIRTGTSRKPGVDDLLSDNSDIIDQELDDLLEMHQEYRNQQEQKRVDAERMLTAKFWPQVYNHPSWTLAQVRQWIGTNTTREFQEIFSSPQMDVALRYLYERMNFISSSPQA